MGFPSGVKWAKRNIGAANVYDFGAYFHWGIPTAHYTSQSYNWGTGNDTYPYSQYGNGGARSQTTDLVDSQDMAYVNWGDEWRCPTKAQVDELLSYTNKAAATQGGVKGITFTSTKNSKSIFIPCGGWYKSTWQQQSTDKGRYWSRSVGGTPADQGYALVITYSTGSATYGNTAKYLGCNVRAVYDPTAA